MSSITSSSNAEDILNDLFEDTIALAKDDHATHSIAQFRDYIVEMLPEDVLLELERIAGGSSFIEDVWTERFDTTTSSRTTTSSIIIDSIPDIALRTEKTKTAEEEDVEYECDEMLADSDCVICERSGLRLTRHHLIPRECHKTILKKSKVTPDLNATIIVCRMCHSTIHRLFTNTELANRYNTLDVLFTDDRLVKYAKWAARLPAGRYGSIGV